MDKRLRLFLFFDVDHKVELVELLGFERRRRVAHHVAAGIVLGECDAVADAVEAGKEADPAVEAVGEATVGRRAVFEGVHQEAELFLGALLGESEELEHLVLQLLVVDTD